MVASTRWWCAFWLGMLLLAGCKSVSKNDNPVFGPSPVRTSLTDADNAMAIAGQDSDAGPEAKAVRLASNNVDEQPDTDDDLFDATVVARVNGAPIFAWEVLEKFREQ